MAEITLQIFNKTPYWHILIVIKMKVRGEINAQETTTKLTQNTIIQPYQIPCKQTLNKWQKKKKERIKNRPKKKAADNY